MGHETRCSCWAAELAYLMTQKQKHQTFGPQSQKSRDFFGGGGCTNVHLLYYLSHSPWRDLVLLLLRVIDYCSLKPRWRRGSLDKLPASYFLYRLHTSNLNTWKIHRESSAGSGSQSLIHGCLSPGPSAPQNLSLTCFTVQLWHLRCAPWAPEPLQARPTCRMRFLAD